jgi:hypothetical protein
MSLTSSTNPATYGEEITLTASINGDSPTGTISFYDGSALLGTLQVENGGYAALSISQLKVGSHILLATYSGDAMNSPAGTDAVMQDVAFASYYNNPFYYNDHFATLQTTVSLSSTSNPALDGNSVSFTAHVTGGQSPAGRVTFYDHMTNIGSAELLSDGSATITVSLPIGTHTIVARYGGDDRNGESSQSLTETIDRYPTNIRCDYRTSSFVFPESPGPNQPLYYCVPRPHPYYRWQ